MPGQDQQDRSTDHTGLCGQVWPTPRERSAGLEDDVLGRIQHLDSDAPEAIAGAEIGITVQPVRHEGN